MKTIFEIRLFFFPHDSSHSSQTSLSWFRLLSDGPDKPWKEDPANLSSSVSSLLCSSSEKMLFIWPKPFVVPFALWGAYRPWDNSKSPSARFLFIKSFHRLLFKSASICLVGETTEGNVKKGCVCVDGWRGGAGIISLSESLCCSLWFNFLWRSSSRPVSDPWWIGSRPLV